jgi:hypothetical protein
MIKKKLNDKQKERLVFEEHIADSKDKLLEKTY